MPKQSLCIFTVVKFKRNLTIIILIRTRSGEYCRVFQCDRNPNKGATQHASGTTLNKPAQKLKKIYIRDLIISKEQISILARKFPFTLRESAPGDSEDCLSHR